MGCAIVCNKKKSIVSTRQFVYADSKSSSGEGDATSAIDEAPSGGADATSAIDETPSGGADATSAIDEAPSGGADATSAIDEGASGLQQSSILKTGYGESLVLHIGQKGIGLISLGSNLSM
jgi:hypothetical protein